MTANLHYGIDGRDDAPTLLLGSSLGTTIELWDPVLGPLARQWRVVRFDHRGHGASPELPGPYVIDDFGRDVLALMDRLRIEKAAYAGISLGGMVGLWLAIHAPERIVRLVACCTSAHPGNPEAWSDRATSVRAAGSTAPVADRVVAGWLTPPFAAAHPEIVSRLREMLLASPPGGYVACCEALPHVDLRDGLRHIRAQTLVIGAEGDTALPPEHGRLIADAVPGARFTLLTGAAHIPIAERPKELTALMIDGLEASHD